MGRLSYSAEEQLRAPSVAGNSINDISVKGGFMDVRGLRGGSQDLCLRAAGRRLARGPTIHISAHFSPLICVFLAACP